MRIVTFAIIVIFVIQYCEPWSASPLPFYRELKFIEKDLLHGNDVQIAQTLLERSPFVQIKNWKFGYFDNVTSTAVSMFQKGNDIKVTSTVNNETAIKLLELHSNDGYRDHHDKEIMKHYKYKIHVPVYRNRSIETKATLFDKDLNILHEFTVRTRGQDISLDDHNARNQFTSNGETPTGLATLDLNSPEPDPKSYGPYPINRVVLGLDGNVKFLLPYIRNGILLHTGEWDDWDESKPMPNSHGCIHAHPNDVEIIYKILSNHLGVEIRENPFGKLPYPYVPQGLISIEMMDHYHHHHHEKEQ